MCSVLLVVHTLGDPRQLPGGEAVDRPAAVLWAEPILPLPPAERPPRLLRAARHRGLRTVAAYYLKRWTQQASVTAARCLLSISSGQISQSIMFRAATIRRRNRVAQRQPCTWLFFKVPTFTLRLVTFNWSPKFARRARSSHSFLQRRAAEIFTVWNVVKKKSWQSWRERASVGKLSSFFRHPARWDSYRDKTGHLHDSLAIEIMC